ncbi:STAS domain-containing protein [Catellatospora chokoriensis]|nr:STAS domain-containing protein [Catellatospora chokoriensis]
MPMPVWQVVPVSGGLRLRLYSGPLGLYLIAEGTLDTTSVHQLSRAVELAMRRLDPVRFTVDVGGVDFIDVAGVATLIACRREAQGRGVGFQVVQATAQVRSTAAACGAFELFSSAGDPVAAAGPMLRRNHRPGLRCLRPPRQSRRPSRNQPRS